MPYLITRQKALQEIETILKPAECLACYLLKSNQNYILHKGDLTTVILTKYPRTWGQAMVILNAHKTSVPQVTNKEWRELTENVRRLTVTLENALNPLRCYITSLGATENLPNTCPHLHFNVLPIYNAEDKPSDILTWKHGVYAAEAKEWENLFTKLKSKWEQCYKIPG